LFGNNKVRTGIDLGSMSVKLVRSVGGKRIKRITHIGVENWNSTDSGDSVVRAAAALRRLLQRLGLRRNQLGHIAVGLGGSHTSFREITLPRLAEDELQRALPYEARKHLNLEDTTPSVLASQILGPAPSSTEDDGEQMWVLLAAVPETRRDFPLQVLSQVGLEPEVIDPEFLAGLNEVLAHEPLTGDGDSVRALLDLGSDSTELHVTAGRGSLMSRTVGPGAPPLGEYEAVTPYVEQLTPRIRETLTFYRGRHRREIEKLYLAGGGALLPEIVGQLHCALDLPVTSLDPLGSLADKARGREVAMTNGARFVTACGLCRWWDVTHV